MQRTMMSYSTWQRDLEDNSLRVDSRIIKSISTNLFHLESHADKCEHLEGIQTGESTTNRQTDHTAPPGGGPPSVQSNADNDAINAPPSGSLQSSTPAAAQEAQSADLALRVGSVTVSIRTAS